MSFIKLCNFGSRYFLIGWLEIKLLTVNCLIYMLVNMNWPACIYETYSKLHKLCYRPPDLIFEDYHDLTIFSFIYHEYNNLLLHQKVIDLDVKDHIHILKWVKSNKMLKILFSFVFFKCIRQRWLHYIMVFQKLCFN